MGSLFPGLPDEIGLKCLLRLELKSFDNVRRVCKRWNAILKNPKFYKKEKIEDFRATDLYAPESSRDLRQSSGIRSE
ncbi:hypothetical protein SUGI_1137720 [Cryptomeria japonica]|nr:hypothetical protein SUGI_1137720 [Cryptomeria japonica]